MFLPPEGPALSPTAPLLSSVISFYATDTNFSDLHHMFVEICVCLCLCTDIVSNHSTQRISLLFGISTELCWVVYKRFQQKEKVIILLKIMVCVICSSVAESGESQQIWLNIMWTAKHSISDCGCYRARTATPIIPSYFMECSSYIFCILCFGWETDLLVWCNAVNTTFALHGLHGNKRDGDDFDASNPKCPLLPG